uniref:Uncharacterized protein n=1 Tax=Arundo donax TaxID=35708 RepID=A0A0A9GSG5_ARUDO
MAVKLNCKRNGRMQAREQNWQNVYIKIPYFQS